MFSNNRFNFIENIIKSHNLHNLFFATKTTQDLV